MDMAIAMAAAAETGLVVAACAATHAATDPMTEDLVSSSCFSDVDYISGVSHLLLEEVTGYSP
jgi:hypothetical protein